MKLVPKIGDFLRLEQASGHGPKLAGIGAAVVASIAATAVLAPEANAIHIDCDDCQHYHQVVQNGDCLGDACPPWYQPGSVHYESWDHGDYCDGGNCITPE